MFRAGAAVLAMAGATLTLAACGALLGITDVPDNKPPDGGATADSGGLGDGPSGTSDATTDGPNNVDGGGVQCHGTCPTVLANDPGCPAYLAVDSSYVYWTSNGASALQEGTVSRCAMSGCSASGPTIITAFSDNPHNLVTDGANVYWGDDDGVNGLPVNTVQSLELDSLTPLGPTSHGSYGITLTPDKSQLIFGDRINGNLVSHPASLAGAITVLVKSAGSQNDVPFQVATDGVNAYYSTLGPNPSGEPDTTAIDVASLSQTNQTIAVFAEDQARPTAVAYSNGYLYWLSAAIDIKVLRCATATLSCDNATTIYTGSKTGVPALQAWGLVVDDTNVYWADSSNGTINRCPIGGCPTNGPTVLVSGLDYPSGLVSNGTTLFWGSFDPACSGGAVMKLDKPQ